MPVKRIGTKQRAWTVVDGQTDLFGKPELPTGLRYTPNVISATEERDLVLRFQKLPLVPFEFHGHVGNRRIYTFGRKYVFAGQKPRVDASIPQYMQLLREIASQVSGAPADTFEQVMVTEYRPGAGIGWHPDRPAYEDIVAISFLAPCILRLRRRAAEDWERSSTWIEPRSVYLFHGEVQDSWQHSIAPMAILRYSVTLRTFRLGRISPKGARRSD